MLRKLFPRQADNEYRGHRIAPWILGVVALMNGVIGLRSIVSTRDVATSADGVPLDTFSAGAQQTVLELFALLGVSRLIMFLLCVIILIRYRALVPLLLAVLVVSQIASRGIHYYLPSPTAGNPPGPMIILSILGLTLLGLGLSLWQRKQPRP